MRKLLVLVVFALAFSVAASAAPISCSDVSLTTLQSLINTNATGGCYSQDKLFTNWGYAYATGGTSAANVLFNVATTVVPGVQDVHGFTFQPTDGNTSSVWNKSFTLIYTISVMSPSTQVIIGAYDQMTLGSLPNASTATSTKGNGVVFSLYQGTALDPHQSASALFPGVTSLTSRTEVSVPDGSFVQNLSENYTQVPTGVPEPMTFVLIGTGLVGLGLIRRRAHKG